MTALADPETSTVCIMNLEPSASPAFVFRMFDDEYEASMKDGTTGDILEIEYAVGYTWVVFSNEAAAKAAVKLLDGRHSRVQGRRLRAFIHNEHAVNPSGYLLSKWKADRKARGNLVTKTVRITGLPTEGARACLNKLIDAFQIWSNNFEDGSSLIPDRVYCEKHVSDGWVQFENEHVSSMFVSLYDHEYWKNGALDIVYVPDHEMPITTNDAVEKHVGFWVGGVKPGSTVDEVQRMFSPFALEDVNLPASKSGQRTPAYAIVFMTQDTAAQFQARHPEGFKHRGRWVKVRPLQKKGKSNGRR